MSDLTRRVVTGVLILLAALCAIGAGLALGVVLDGPPL